jgi:hypothetical protein
VIGVRHTTCWGLATANHVKLGLVVLSRPGQAAPRSVGRARRQSRPAGAIEPPPIGLVGERHRRRRLTYEAAGEGAGVAGAGVGGSVGKTSGGFGGIVADGAG